MKILKHKGLIFALSYYLLGLLISYVIYKIFGWNYIHAPGYHHMTFVLFLIGGVIWNFISISKFISNRNTFHLESLIVHSIVALATISIFIYASYSSGNNDQSNLKDSNLETVTIISRNDSSMIINGHNDTLYLKIGDSLIIDRQ